MYVEACQRCQKKLRMVLHILYQPMLCMLKHVEGVERSSEWSYTHYTIKYYVCERFQKKLKVHCKGCNTMYVEGVEGT